MPLMLILLAPGQAFGLVAIVKNNFMFWIVNQYLKKPQTLNLKVLYLQDLNLKLGGGGMH